MAGNKQGGIKAAQSNKERHGDDFYKRLGAMGGAIARPESRWFALHPDLAKEAGRKGGLISRRGPSKHKQEETNND